MQLLGGGALGEVKQPNNTLGGGESTKLAMMNTAGGVSWLPSSTAAAAAAAASQLAGQPNLLGPQASIASAMSVAGLSCYPFPNPFLPGGSWLPTPGGMLATTALPPHLRPPMLSLDPNSAYKQVFNPALIPYRYPLAVTQPLKNFPSATSQVSQSPSLGGSNLSQTPSGTATPHSTMYPVGPNTNLSAFHSVGTEPGGIGTGGNTSSNSATPPLLCLPPTQPQGFPGMLPPTQVLPGGGKDDNNGGNANTKVPETSAAPQGVNWMQNPAAIMGSATGFNMMPYLMGQAQLGITGPPGSQHMFNAPQLAGGVPQPSLYGSEGNLAMMGGGAGSAAGTIAPSKDHPAMFVPRKPQAQRRGSSTSVELVRGEISPSNTPPLGMGPGGGVGVAVGGSKKPQYSIMMPHEGSGVGKWKAAGDQAASPPIVIHPYEYPNSDTTPSTFSSTSAMHMITPSGHMVQGGFPGMAVAHPHSHLHPKGRGEMMLGGGGRGSPRGAHSDKPKLRMHHVRDDDFKQPVKPDRRRKRWRGKNRDNFLSTRAEQAEASLHRMGKMGEPLSTSIHPFPASMTVEPGSNKVGISVPEKYVIQREANNLCVPITTAAGSKDGNYALNMLADMSSIQSSKEKQEGKVQTAIPSSEHRSGEGGGGGVPQATPATTSSDSSSRHHLRSPVTLAARSLLMLGEDLSQSHDVTHVENTAATSLLQLSGAVLSGNDESQAKLSVTRQNQTEENTDQEEKNTEGHSTRSASFSAAEAMIMMGAGNKPSEDTASTMGTTYTEEVFDTTQHNQSPQSTDSAKKDSPAGTVEQQKEPKSGSVKSKRPRTLTLDSEVTDTDSEATLTPAESPYARKGHTPHFSVENENTEMTCQEHHRHSPPGTSREFPRQHDGEVVGSEFNVHKSDTSPPNSSERSLIEHSGNTIVPDSEAASSKDHVPAHPDFTTSTSPKTFSIDQSREEDVACTAKDDQSVTMIAGSLASEQDHREGRKANTTTHNLRDTSSATVASPAIPASTRFTVAGTFTPPSALPPNDLEGGSREEGEVNKDKSLAKRPKFISTFGPVSETDTCPILPLEIDGSSGGGGGRGESPVSSSLVNLSPGMTGEVSSLHSTDGELDVAPPADPKESSSITAGRQDLEGRSEIDVPIIPENIVQEGERDVGRSSECLPECRGSGSSVSVNPSRQRKLDLMHETNVDEDCRAGATEKCEVERNASTQDLDNRQESASPAYKAESVTTSRSPCKSNKEIVSSAPEKEKTKHRIIKIKRNNSTRILSVAAPTPVAPPTAPPTSRSDSKSRNLPSWTAFADAVDQDNTNPDGEAVEKERADDKSVQKMQESEKRSGRERRDDGSPPSSARVEVDDSISSSKVMSDVPSGDVNHDVLQTNTAVTVVDAVAPQNRLVISRSTKHHQLQHRKHGAQLAKHGSSKKDKGGKLNQERKAKDLFDVELPEKASIIERPGDIGKEKRSKDSQLLSNKSVLSHTRQMTSGGSEELDHHHQRCAIDSYSGSQAGEGTRSHVVCDSDTISSTTNKSRTWNQNSPGYHSQFSGTGSRTLEQEFSPLSDDDDDEMARPTSPPVPSRRFIPKDSSSKWSEMEEWERKGQQKWHQGEFVDSAAPLVSPSSSTSSSSAKKPHSHHRHHHRHYERVPGGGGDVPLLSKHERRREESASTSRGSSPAEHKKHHRHHHHSSYHHRGHSRDKGRSQDSSSKQSSHERTPKGDNLVGVAAHLGKEDWHDSSFIGALPGGSRRNRKRVHVSSDEDDEPLPDISAGGGVLSAPGSKRKMKHNREHKERWKDSNKKHKHAGHKH